MNILLTGPPGCGKTTLVQSLIRSLEGRRLAGIVTPEIRRERRTGFLIADLATGAEEVLASVEIRGGPRVGRYGVNAAGVDKITALFRESLEGAEFVFIDEIGRMELCSAKFRELAGEIFDCGKPLVAVVHRGLIGQFQDKGEVIRVERERSAQIQKDVLGKLLRTGK